MAVADALTDGLEVWLSPDLATYAQAIGRMFSQVETLSADTDTDDGWSIILDVDRCPDYALPYLGQFVGVSVPIGTDEASARQLIRDKPRQSRGTPASIVAAAQRNLTGSKSVVLRERDGAVGTDDPYRITVITYTAETPDPDAVLNEILTVKPGGIVLNYLTLAGQDWQAVANTYGTWTAVDTAYPNWRGVKSDLPSV